MKFMKSKRVLLFLLFAISCSMFVGCGRGQKRNISEVTIGSYNGEPLLWKVIAESDDMLLLQTNAGRRVFDDTENCKWEESSLRKWLNEDFYDEVFSEEEKKALETIDFGIFGDSYSAGWSFRDSNQNLICSVLYTSFGNVATKDKVSLLPVVIEEGKPRSFLQYAEDEDLYFVSDYGDGLRAADLLSRMEWTMTVRQGGGERAVLVRNGIHGEPLSVSSDLSREIRFFEEMFPLAAERIRGNTYLSIDAFGQTQYKSFYEVAVKRFEEQIELLSNDGLLVNPVIAVSRDSITEGKFSLQEAMDKGFLEATKDEYGIVALVYNYPKQGEEYTGHRFVQDVNGIYYVCLDPSDMSRVVEKVQRDGGNLYSEDTWKDISRFPELLDDDLKKASIKNRRGDVGIYWFDWSTLEAVNFCRFFISLDESMLSLDDGGLEIDAFIPVDLNSIYDSYFCVEGHSYE